MPAQAMPRARSSATHGPTRTPKGWACFSACNFIFMGGVIRYVDQGGIFAVHMFTHLGDKEAVRSELLKIRTRRSE